MFEDYAHDPKAKKDEEELNERTFLQRFGTNPNMVAQWRKRKQEKAARKKEGEQGGK